MNELAVKPAPIMWNYSGGLLRTYEAMCNLRATGYGVFEPSTKTGDQLPVIA